jgi:murein tripeptide amidase MpaA
LEKQHLYQRYFIKMKPALQSKREEFQLLGMQEVTEKDIWNMLINKKWKKPQEDIHSYEIMQDILSLTNSDYMTFRTIEAYKAPNVFTELTSKELNELLKN